MRRTLERWEMLPLNSPKEAIFSVGLDIQKIATSNSDPTRGVLHYLGEYPHDLIVLATHQHKGVDRWTHKQVAEPIARRSGEMTLFIPHGSEGFVSLESGAVSLRNILIPVDHSPDPHIAVEGAVSFAHALECRGVNFTLLHVGGEDSFPEVVMSERETPSSSVASATATPARRYSRSGWRLPWTPRMVALLVRQISTRMLRWASVSASASINPNSASAVTSAS